MKRVTLLAFSLLSIWTFSQTRYSDQSMFAVGGGITGKKGFYTNISYTRFIGNAGWVGRADLVYISQKAHIKNIPEDKEIDLTQYLLMPMAQYDFEYLGLDPLYLSIFGGAVLGYEKVNKGSNILANSGIQSDKLKNNFIYGVGLGVQGEVELSRSLNFTISAMEMYRRGSKVGNLSFMVGAGFKYYF